MCAYFDNANIYLTGKNGIKDTGTTYSLTRNDTTYATITIDVNNDVTMTFTNYANGYISLSGECSNGANAFVTKNEPLP